jgi:hypothetical protein
MVTSAIGIEVIKWKLSMGNGNATFGGRGYVEYNAL